MVHLTDEQLKVASILDLTDDVELMRKVLDDDLFEPSDIKSYSPQGKMFSLLDFADYMKDGQLRSRLNSIFKDELDDTFNE